MSKPNWKNQTIWTGDNLEIMRGMNSESVDLIYLDPPFNSKANYAAPIGSSAAGAAFKDTWTLSDVDVEWINLVEAKHPALHRVLLAAMSPSDKSYLAYMAVRLLELRRLIKPTGSVYLHCDPTMSHYLKLVMDAVFGADSFQNEIIWKRTPAKALMTRRLPSNHDVIFCYQGSGESTWNADAIFVPYDPGNLDAKTASKYRLREADGRLYQLDNLLNPNRDRPNLTYEFLGVTRVWRWTRERMRAAYDAGLVVQPSPGSVPRLKRYLDEQRGRPLGDVWSDINPINSQAKERIGYPTQKPTDLLKRIIEISSKPRDIVFDPFCGCATTLVASDDLGRQWVGIDISSKAADLVAQRITAKGIDLIRGIVHREDIPRRTDLGKLPPYNSRENKTKLYGEQEGHCAGCSTHFEMRNLEVDHIIARAKGGTDHIENLQLLCGNCNSIKGDRGMEYLRVKLQIAS